MSVGLWISSSGWCRGGRNRRHCAGALLALVLASSWAAAAAELPLRWRWSNPLPHGNSVADMSYSAALALGVQVTDGGRIYTSADLQTWIPRESGTFRSLRGVGFLGSRLVAVGEEGTVLYADAPDAWFPGVLANGATTNWLESVASSGQLLVAVGDNAAIYTSTNGETWERQTAGVTTHWLRSVAYGTVASQGRFVAVGEAGTLLVSAGGTNWTARPSGVATDLNRVSFGNGEFNVVGDGGVVLRSVDLGQNWFARASGAKTNLYAVTTGGTKLLVAGDSEVRVFDPLLSLWSNEMLQVDAPPAWSYYAAIGRAGLFVLGGRSGMLVEGNLGASGSFSWQPLAVSSHAWLFDTFSVTNLLVSVGDRSTIMTSSDGLDWALESVPSGVTNAVLLGVGGTTNLLVAAGSAGALLISPQNWTNLVSTNADGTLTNRSINTLGVVWTLPKPAGVTNDLQGVTWFNDRYIVTGGGGTILTSPEGTNWTLQTPPTNVLLSSAAASSSNAVAAGRSGVIVWSPDGERWSVVASGTTNWVYRVRWLAGGYVAVGQNGLILSSPDGINWVSRSSGTTAWLYDVSWVDGTWFAVGSAGTVLAAADLDSWTNAGSITSKALYGATTDGRRLIVVGVDGAILRSPVVPDLTPVEILDYSRLMTTNGLTAQDIFLFAGKPDQRFTLDDLLELGGQPWNVGPELEFLEGSGTLYYLHSTAASNAPPTTYYRGTLAP